LKILYNFQNTSDEIGLVKAKFELESGLNNFKLMLEDTRRTLEVKEKVLVSML
jgi:hypothetical protein